jgi:hypothetical protein
MIHTLTNTTSRDSRLGAPLWHADFVMLDGTCARAGVRATRPVWKLGARPIFSVNSQGSSGFGVDRLSGPLIYHNSRVVPAMSRVADLKARDPKIPAFRFSNTPHPPREVIAARLSPPLFLYSYGHPGPVVGAEFRHAAGESLKRSAVAVHHSIAGLAPPTTRLTRLLRTTHEIASERRAGAESEALTPAQSHS